MNPKSQTNQAEEAHLVHSFPRNEREEFQITLKKYRGRLYGDLRVWYQDETDDTLKPSKKGIVFPLEKYAEIRRGLERLAHAASKKKPVAAGPGSL